MCLLNVQELGCVELNRHSGRTDQWIFMGIHSQHDIDMLISSAMRMLFKGEPSSVGI